MSRDSYPRFMSSVGIEADALLGPLERAIEEAVGARALVSATARLDPGIDPSALALGSRLASDRWFCWEQPDRDGFALAGIGAAAELISRGAGRFRDVAADCALIARELLHSGPTDLPSGAGPVFVGGFAFDNDGAAEAHWASLPPALLVLPELSLWRRGSDAYATLTVQVSRDASEEQLIAKARARLASLEKIGRASCRERVSECV